MPLDVILMIIAAALLFIEGFGRRPAFAARYGLQSIAFGLLVVVAIIWRY